MVKSELLRVKVGIVLIGIWFVFADGFANAQEDWTLYGVTKYFILFYDSNSISHPSKGMVKLWIRSVSKCNDRLDWAIKDHPNCANVEWMYVVTLIEIDCSTRQDRDIKSVGYGKEGVPVESSPDEASPWNDMIPESYIEILYKILCP